ncbi:tetratricopeptide repeat protein [Noviherbaspirillum malthae]|uniref:tetratricopeptide repeat protein n=1 Tax=Noviherbaspirillum malthae TaxID=1260987 RepID=UPI00188E623A|nr:tetratricopeptide repeat protein [Noviherbaspirillum malthae]
MKHTAVLILGVVATLAAYAAPPDPMQMPRSFFAEGDYANAVKGFEDVLRTFPADAVVMNNLAVAKAANGDYQGALALLSQAVQLAPHVPGIEANRRQLQDYLQPASARRADLGADSSALPDPPALWASSASSPVARRVPTDRPDCARKKPCK